MKGKLVVKALLAVSICCSVVFATQKMEVKAGELIEAEETETEEIEAEEIAVGESLDEEPLIGSVDSTYVDRAVVWDESTKTLTIISDKYYSTRKKAETTGYSDDDVERIKISPSVTAIKSEAFLGFSKLKTVELSGSSIKEIGYRAFYNCDSLESITLPDGLRYIGNEAFRECDGLKSINLPDSVVMIGDRAFYSCYNLESVSFGSGITRIGAHAFDKSKELKTVNFAKTDGLVIETYAFSFTGIEEVNLPEGLVRLEDNPFTGEARNIGKLKRITFPESLKEIGEGVVDLTYVEAITIPAGVSKIDDKAIVLASYLN